MWSVSMAAPVLAQEPAGDARANEAPAHISVVDGAAILERDGRSETAPTSMPILAGDRLRTQNGRVEVLFADGSTLHLDTSTRVDFQSDEVIRLLDGRVRLNIPGAGSAGMRNVDYRVDASSAWVQIIRSGEYRISVLGATTDGRDGEIELAVLRGAADLVNEDGRTSIGAGERAFARAGARPSAAYVFNSASWDAFDRWSESQRDARLGVSAEYLPESVQTYAATFNQYGYWQNEPTYGYVWYPRARPGWRPYYSGQWTSLRPWGWTWIGSDPWAWPTHHYGRWGFSAGSWFWIPGATWGPAWVSWAYAPGYVSWCPLGWNNRAVFGFSAGVYGGYRYDPWNAWTVVPHHGFGRGHVNAHVVNSTRIDARTRNTFVIRDTSPDGSGIAVPRSGIPIRSVGARVAPRGDNTAYRGSRSAPGTPGSNPDDAAAVFRNRGSSSAPLSGSGYPAPARNPRSMSSVPAPTRQTPTRSYSAGPSTSDPAASGTAPAGSGRRAVPRGTSPSADPAATPSRRNGSGDVYSPGQSSRPEIYRAVPRSERPRQDAEPWTPPPVIYGTPSTTPSRSYRAPSDGGSRPPSAETGDPGMRAVPRSAPPDGGYRAPERYRAPESSRPTESSRPPQSYRSPENQPSRSGQPSGPPPSAAPSRPSGPPPSSSGGEGGARSRSGGGGGSVGRAVPRGGRG
jgi:hypothetical protein